MSEPIIQTYTSTGGVRNSPTISAWKPLGELAKTGPYAKEPIIFSAGELAAGDTPSKALKTQWRASFDAQDIPEGAPRGGAFSLFDQNSYAPAAGTNGLRATAAWKYGQETGIAGVTGTNVAVATGGKGVLNGIANMVKRDEEVIVASPCWPTNFDMFREGVKLVIVDTNGRGLMSAEQLQAALKAHPKARMVLFNSPCNPTGATYTPDEREAFLKVVAEHNAGLKQGYKPLMAIDDNPYGRLVYDGQTMERGQVERELFDSGALSSVRCISKEYGLPGHRVGFVVSKDSKVIDHVQQYNECKGTTASCDAMDLAQQALLYGEKFIQATVEKLRDHRDTLVRKAREIAGLSIEVPNAIYGWVDYSGLKGKKFGDTTIATPKDLAEFLAKKAGVVMLPGAPFCSPEPEKVQDEWHMRLSFAGDVEKMKEAFDRIGKAVVQLQTPMADKIPPRGDRAR